jgi:hypothetical protein
MLFRGTPSVALQPANRHHSRLGVDALQDNDDSVILRKFERVLWEEKSAKTILMWIGLNIALQNTRIRGAAHDDDDGERFLRLEPMG